MTYCLDLSKLSHEGDSLTVGCAIVLERSRPLVQSISASALSISGLP